MYAVARKGGRIVAAGRAGIERLAPAPAKPFKVFWIGRSGRRARAPVSRRRRCSRRARSDRDPDASRSTGRRSRPPGEPCAGCGAPLARDQRYCLSCGARRAGLSALLSGDPPRGGDDRPAVAAVEPVPEAVAPAAADAPWRLDAGLVAGVGCLLLALLVGVLIGRSGELRSDRAAAPQVVTVGGHGHRRARAPCRSPPTGRRASAASPCSCRRCPRPAPTQRPSPPPSRPPRPRARRTSARSTPTSSRASTAAATSSTRASTPTARPPPRALKDVEGDFPDAKVVEVSDTAPTADSGDSEQPSKAEQAAASRGDQRSRQRQRRRLLEEDAQAAQGPRESGQAATQGRQARRRRVRDGDLPVTMIDRIRPAPRRRP